MASSNVRHFVPVARRWFAAAAVWKKIKMEHEGCDMRHTITTTHCHFSLVALSVLEILLRCCCICKRFIVSIFRLRGERENMTNNDILMLLDDKKKYSLLLFVWVGAHIGLVVRQLQGVHKFDEFPFRRIIIIILPPFFPINIAINKLAARMFFFRFHSNAMRETSRRCKKQYIYSKINRMPFIYLCFG